MFHSNIVNLQHHRNNFTELNCALTSRDLIHQFKVGANDNNGGLGKIREEKRRQDGTGREVRFPYHPHWLIALVLGAFALSIKI